jgi:hypothetical protein
VRTREQIDVGRDGQRRRDGEQRQRQARATGEGIDDERGGKAA